VIWPAIVLTGIGSYILRVLPLVVLPKVTVPPAVERGIRHAGIAAITALLVSSVTHHVDAGDLLPTIVAVAVGLALAMRGAAMLRVVAIGGLSYLAMLVVSVAV
jgi:branched-subunit amino acid transport protein